ncbi:MAG TPA: isoleucine--tRNA ligase [Chitinophagales bacterium]|nr:isoleucine--tRNA ligase [Chitinophagales bacterium]HNJ90485.1 isoleucine--tRNA ligase [Chitinophagales bacterium]
MSTKKYPESKSLNLPLIEKEVLQYWKSDNTFQKSVSSRPENKPFVFYEGPPSANGTPGIHHVLARSLKDLVCRYKTMQGFRVERKSGWDTHGLPVELGVEKTLGITKEEIGKTISVAEYNEHCRKEVMKYTAQWEELTNIMGYWVDMEDPYVTYDHNYIETLWNLLKRLYDKGLLYKGFTIQPYSPAAGTGLSSHELNQPGTYKPVKDTTATAMFRILPEHIPAHLMTQHAEVFFLAWTTTPWTLPSNTALAVGANITYVQIDTFNPYTQKPISVILAKDRVPAYFKDEQKVHALISEEPAGWKPVSEFTGKQLEGIRYEQLWPYHQPTNGDAFRVITGDFVTTEDGTGIVHIAPSFGSDDFRVAKQNGIGSLTLVDKEGKFVDGMGDLSGRFVKNYKDEEKWENPDVIIAIKLKESNRAFRVEKYEHNYPHCWRTDKPVIYYPLDSWFIRTTAAKERLIALNKTINWKPASTGEGRFGQWLENLVDWNLSRSRYWGTPLPIWRSEDGAEELCIGSFEQLQKEVDRARDLNPHLPADWNAASNFDPHRPFVDEIVLRSASGKPMRRESDLIDVWFDSGAMPFAQWHWPFENTEVFDRKFPADFIAEGVDQTRGWFFTLHVIATLINDSVAYKNVISNGLVLDKNGNKMSKRLGNAVDPFHTINNYGADATRWYMITNAQPWDNLKFDTDGIVEVQRKFFGTLYNTYAFFALYANVDEFRFEGNEIPVSNRSELDRWVISLLNSLTAQVTEALNDYEPTRAGRAIQDFVGDHLSNWYVRLSRRRFWKSDDSADKQAAYQTLYTCLDTISRLMAPIAPFMSEWLFRNLNGVTGKHQAESVHLSTFPVADPTLIDRDLEDSMQLAQDISSTVLSLRKKQNIKVRQPLSKIMIPVLSDTTRRHIERVAELVKSEVNIKEIEFISEDSGVITKKIKPNFKALGPKLGGDMKSAAGLISGFSQQQISELERNKEIILDLGNKSFTLSSEDVEILSEDIPGWLVAPAGTLTVALDITVTDALLFEGHARELVSQLQRMRKDMNLAITDRISVTYHTGAELSQAIEDYKQYICAEILADSLETSDGLSDTGKISVNDIEISIQIKKV